MATSWASNLVTIVRQEKAFVVSVATALIYSVFGSRSSISKAGAKHRATSTAASTYARLPTMPSCCFSICFL